MHYICIFVKIKNEMENLNSKITALYNQQINEIAALAKEINYDLDSDIKPLVDLWLKRATASHKALTENPEATQRVIKTFIKKSK